MKVLVFGCVQFVSICNTSRYKLGIIIGPSGVHALPVAAGTNEGGHYCHTRTHLAISAQLKIWQVLACKMGPRSGIIICIIHRHISCATTDTYPAPPPTHILRNH